MKVHELQKLAGSSLESGPGEEDPQVLTCRRDDVPEAGEHVRDSSPRLEVGGSGSAHTSRENEGESWQGRLLTQTPAATPPLRPPPRSCLEVFKIGTASGNQDGLTLWVCRSRGDVPRPVPAKECFCRGGVKCFR